jgi:hypothetical protein
MCDRLSRVSRRRFLATTAVAATAVSSAPRFLYGAPSRSSTAETLIGEFYEGLSGAQRAEICLELTNPLMRRANANWHITKPLIGSDFYSKSQQALIEKVVSSVTSEDGHDRLQKQMDYDDGGLQAYSVALFGNPKEGEFQWVLTGRHLTLRADGNTMKDSAFGGPLVYGHGEESSAAANLFYYQTQKVNSVFHALDSKQREKALLTDLPAESQVAPKHSNDGIAGLAVADMSADQKQLVADVLKTILSPYREDDTNEAMEIIKHDNGIDLLRFAFYRNGDIESDGVWDMWRIEGPRCVIHFRGSPHVHAYIDIG